MLNVDLGQVHSSTDLLLGLGFTKGLLVSYSILLQIFIRYLQHSKHQQSFLWMRACLLARSCHYCFAKVLDVHRGFKTKSLSCQQVADWMLPVVD